MSKLSKAVIFGILAILVIFLALYIAAMNSVISNGGYEKGGQILFVNKSNPQTLILNQQYLTGAWDGESSYRNAKKNLITGKTESIDTSTIDRREWIRVKVPFYIWESWEDRGFFSRERFKEFFTDFSDKGQLKFKLNKLSSFKELQLPETELPPVLNHWSSYSDNTFSKNFKAYVFLINGALVLNTVNNDFSLIDEKALMKKYSGKDFTYLLYSDFTDDDHFTATQIYTTFILDSDGKQKPGTIDEVRVINHYRISRNGEIKRTSKGLFGEISVSHPKM